VAVPIFGFASATHVQPPPILSRLDLTMTRTDAIKKKNKQQPSVGGEYATHCKSSAKAMFGFLLTT
jgi:hypothetical protein